MRLFKFLLLTLLIGACIDPFAIKLANSEDNIIIEGLITDQPGPYTIKVYKTSSLTAQLESTNWIKGASVTITDDSGIETKLSEISPGNYQTNKNELQGIVGKSYFARIVTTNGIYESLPEKLLPVGELTNLYFDFKQNEDPKKTDYLSTTNGFDIYVDSKVLPEQNGLVRWRWTGTFAIKTFPEKQTKTQGGKGGGIEIIPVPPKCSGWVYSVKGGLQQVSDLCECCNCWVTQYNDTPELSDKSFIPTDEIKKHKVAFIPANKRYFYQKYYIEVEQMSISQIIYDFWKKVEIQKRTSSNLFQTPPPQTSGNIKSLTTGAPDALGYFGASSIKKKGIFIDRMKVPYFLPPDTTAMSCQLIYKNSSNLKPAFW